ncbi:MAG: murein biosynthesis integral membrane protein MurJ [Candidatus Tectimicrobiota bacterium]
MRGLWQTHRTVTGSIMADALPPPSSLRARLQQLRGRLRPPSVLRRGLPIVLATLASRPLGYVRVAIQAWLFGATAAMDAFVLAFSLPSMLQVILLTGPLSGVLVPTLTAYQKDRQLLTQVFNSLLTWCACIGLGIAVLAAWGAPLCMRLAGPGLAPATHLLAAQLFQLMLPMLVLQALLSVCKGALNAVDHYGAPEYAGAVFNLVMIAAPLLLAARFGVLSLAVGASLGALAQLLMQFPFLAHYGIRYRPRWRFSVDVRPMLRLAQGAFISTLITPINSFIDRALASLLFAGAIAALHYAFLLFLLPASLCVVPVSTVLLTDLAGLYHQQQMALVRRRAQSALLLMGLLTLPVSLGGILWAEPLTRLVYEYGRFQAADTQLTAQALRAYLLGLPFYGATHLLTRCFYATHDTMTPALVSIGALVLNALSDVVLMQWYGHWGIALASSVVMLASTIALYSLFQRRCTRLEQEPPALLDSAGEVG